MSSPAESLGLFVGFHLTQASTMTVETCHSAPSFFVTSNFWYVSEEARRLRRDQGSLKYLLILSRRNQDLCTETLEPRIWVFLEIAASTLLCRYSAHQVPDNLVTGKSAGLREGGSSEAGMRGGPGRFVPGSHSDKRLFWETH